jgi:hypothetical protein
MRQAHFRFIEVVEVMLVPKVRLGLGIHNQEVSREENTTTIHSGLKYGGGACQPEL